MRDTFPPVQQDVDDGIMRAGNRATADRLTPGAVAASPAVSAPGVCAAATSDAGATGTPDTMDAGLRADQLAAMQAAHFDRRRIRRAASIAALSGWTMMTFAILTLVSGIFSLPAFVLGAGLTVAASLELRGAKALRHLDIAAPRRLALNQLALGAMLCLYASWGIFTALTAPSRYADQVTAGGEVARLLEPIDNLHKLVSVVVYVTMIVIGFVACGCTSLYYATRRRVIEAHLHATPAWVVEAMRSVD